MSAIAVSVPQSYRIIGMNSSQQADIAITGTYTFASSAHIEASYAGGAFTRIATVSSGTGTAFSGTLTNQAAGVRTTLVVRFEEDHATTTTVIMGIGWVILEVGDSTVSDYYPTNYTYSGTAIGVSVITNASAFYNDWNDCNSEGVNYASARIADLLAQATNFCVGVFRHSQGGTDLHETSGDAWDPTHTGINLGPRLYEIKNNFLVNNPATVHGVFVSFGPNAMNENPAQATYQARQRRFSEFFRDNITGSPPCFYKICGEVASITTAYDTIRGAIVDDVAAGTPSYMGAVIYNQEYESGASGEVDGVHPRTPAHRTEIGNRFYVAAKPILSGTGSNVRGPRPVTVYYSGANVILNFNQEFAQATSTTLGAGAWAATSNGSAATITGVSVSSAGQVTVVTSATLVAPVTVSYAKQNTAGEPLTIPTSTSYTLPDSTTVQLPAEPIYATAASALPATSGISKARWQLGM